MNGYTISVIGLIGSLITIYLFFFDRRVKKPFKKMVFVFSVLLFFIGFIINKYMDFSSTDYIEFNTYINKKIGFQISYPENWEIRLTPNPNESDEYYIVSINNNEDDPMMMVYIMETPNLEITDEDECIINDYKFYTSNYMSNDAYISLYMFCKNNTTYSISLGCVPGAYRKRTEEIFDIIINSLYIYSD